MSEEQRPEQTPAEPVSASGGSASAPIPFGRYRLIERIGAGGMAEIWRAVAVGEQGFERTVAIKRIREEVAQLADIGRLFADEARLSALLDHPNIVQVYDFGTVDGACYIAMEYLPGRNLDQVLLALRRTGERVEPGLAAFIAREVARGLAHAHGLRDGRGRPYHIVHRDVSPANVMLLQAGAVKLLDFGIARVTSELRLAVTQGRALRGKCPYLAPEQITGGPVDGRSDIFALGVVLWEMLTGQRLFGGESDLDTIANVMNRVIPRPSTLAPGVPAGLDRIVMAALARDTDRRYRLADFMAADLDEVMRTMPGRHDDLPALIGRLFGPHAHERGPGAAEAGAPVTWPAITAPRFALELPTDPGGVRPPAGPDEVTRRELPLIDAGALPLGADPGGRAAPLEEQAPGDSREVITAVELGSRLTTGRGRRAVRTPGGARTFGLVLGTLIVTELVGSLLVRALGQRGVDPAGGRPAAAIAAAPRCPAAGPAAVCPLPPPRAARAVTSRARATGARPPAPRPAARGDKRGAARPKAWAIGRRTAAGAGARRAPAARMSELHVDPFVE
jgi:hypothetical protein